MEARRLRRAIAYAKLSITGVAFLYLVLLVIRNWRSRADVDLVVKKVVDVPVLALVLATAALTLALRWLVARIRNIRRELSETRIQKAAEKKAAMRQIGQDAETLRTRENQ